LYAHTFAVPVILRALGVAAVGSLLPCSGSRVVSTIPGVPRVNEGGTRKPKAQRHWLGLAEPGGSRGPEGGELEAGAWETQH